MASGLRLTYICLSWTFSVTQSKGHSSLATFFGTGFGTCGYNDKQSEIRRVMHLIFLFLSKLDNNLRKSIMICEITDSVHNHFCEYL